MRYVIAGGGAYGAHYVKKLLEAIDLGKVELDEIVVVDHDAACQVAEVAKTRPVVRLEVSDWRRFAAQVWADPTAWAQDIWIPAPIAPHILADWVIDRVKELTGLEVAAEQTPVSLPDLPFAQQHPDGRIFLSHAPGRCPLDCTEPATCAITKDTRWWEMRDTLTELIAQHDLALDVDRVAMFLCRHHCDPSQHDVGGIPFTTICAETDRVCRHAKQGADQIGVATFSSCHGVLTRLAVKTAGVAAMNKSDAPVVELERWAGPWSADDSDANLKADVAAHCLLDPLQTLSALAQSTDIPVGALAHYVLARWATAGSGGLLEIGPAMVQRLWAPVAEAEADNDDAQRLAAYHQLREMLSWLRFPLEHPDAYPKQT